MTTMATVRVNTTQQMILYRDFVIEESTEGWEWTHQNYDRLTYPVTGTVQTVFECIDAIDEWHARPDAASLSASQKDQANVEA